VLGKSAGSSLFPWTLLRTELWPPPTHVFKS
jgi:hypothetical protein